MVIQKNNYNQDKTTNKSFKRNQIIKNNIGTSVI